MLGRRIELFWCELVETSNAPPYIYRRTDTGETFPLGQAPVGAAYFADWLDTRGPDGHCLIVITPAGPWNVDGQFVFPQLGRWTRTGEPPKVTVTPSIGMGGQGAEGGPPWGFHAWLRDGFLEDVE